MVDSKVGSLVGWKAENLAVLKVGNLVVLMEEKLAVMWGDWLLMQLLK